MKFRFKKLCTAVAGAMLLAALSGCGAGSNDAEVVKQLKKDYRDLVKLGDYKGIVYEPTDTSVTDDDVQTELDYLVHQNTTQEQLKTGVATWGDAVNIDYVGYIDGEAFDGGNTQGAGTNITLGSSGYIDNFDEQIVGHKPGDSFDVNVTFPEDYQNEELAGAPAKFETTLNYIVGDDIVPEVNDSFIETATNGEYKTVDEYKKATREQMQEERTQNGETTDKQAILQQVIDETTIVEYPEQEMKERTESIIASYEDYAASNNVDLSTLLSYYFGYDAEQFEESVKSSVESYIREKMVIIAIADAEGITCTDEEYNARVKELLEQTGLNDVSQLNQQYGYNDEDYYFTVLEEKVIELLYENAVKGSPTDAATEAVTEAQ
jgi:trigger factor